MIINCITTNVMFPKISKYQHIYFSPHLDDVVLSCAANIALQTNHGDSVLVVTIFTGSNPQSKKVSSSFLLDYFNTDSASLCETLGRSRRGAHAGAGRAAIGRAHVLMDRWGTSGGGRCSNLPRAASARCSAYF